MTTHPVLRRPVGARRLLRAVAALGVLAVGGVASVGVAPTRASWVDVVHATGSGGIVPSREGGMELVTAGNAHTVAVRDGLVFAVGNNPNGELGRGNSSIAAGTWAQVRTGNSGPSYLSGVTDLAAGAVFTIALTSDGRVMTWGGNSAGQLGRNGTQSSNLAQQVFGGSPSWTGPVTAVAAGPSWAGVIAGGNAYVWGANTPSPSVDGQVPVRVEIPGDPVLRDITLGETFGAVLTVDGDVYTWGDNSVGQLGRGDVALLYATEVADLGDLDLTEDATGAPDDATAIPDDVTEMGDVTAPDDATAPDVADEGPSKPAPETDADADPQDGDDPEADADGLPECLPADLLQDVDPDEPGDPEEPGDPDAPVDPDDAARELECVMPEDLDPDADLDDPDAPDLPVASVALRSVVAPSARAFPATAPGRVSLPGVTVRDITAGHLFVAALGEDESGSSVVYTWGGNADGQLGTGTRGGSSDVPVRLTAATGDALDPVHVIARYATGITSRTGSTVVHLQPQRGVIAVVWGVSQSNKLSAGPAIDAGSPQAVAAPSLLVAGTTPPGATSVVRPFVSLTSVGIGNAHMVAVGTDGYLYGVGTSTSSPLGVTQVLDALYRIPGPG